MIRLDDNRLVYEGSCADVGFGGEYAIGCQSVDEFLDSGPLDASLPPAVVDDLRRYLQEPHS
jgi:hypothetical protein